MLKITHPFGLFLPEFLNLPYLCLSDFGKQLCIVLKLYSQHPILHFF